MSKSICLIGTLLCAMLLISCSKSESTTNRDMKSTTVPAASPAATTTTASTSGGKIGVPECDQYIAAYEACVKDKVPANLRATFESTLTQTRQRWHEAAANPQSKATLAAACKTAMDQAKQSMKAYNCTW